MAGLPLEFKLCDDDDVGAGGEWMDVISQVTTL